MMQDLLDKDYRKKIINEIKSDENLQRKIVSFKKQNMQNDNFYQYVVEYLESKLDQETVKELHVFADVNLQKRVSKSEAGIYRSQPQRTFTIKNKSIDEFNTVYDLMGMDACLRRANEAYKYQDQCAIQIYPEDGNLKARVLLPHHYDVIPHQNNPEKPFAYIISNFDNTSRDRIRKRNDRTGFSQGDRYRDNVNQDIADPDDSKLEHERYYVFSGEYNFVMDGRANILTKDDEQVITEAIDDTNENVVSPLAEYGCTGFIDISAPKDFEYWVRSGDVLYDATIKYNTIVTSEFQTVEMQGHAQPYYKGDAEHMPENVRIGVDKMIYIPINPNNPTQAEFGFANPGSDLSGIREFRESYLASFLSSRGLNTGIISGKPSMDKASSGIEKMLQMIEKFEASQEDFSLFKSAEIDVCYAISCWIAALKGERVDGKLVLDEPYQLSIQNPDDIDVNVEYAKPELIQTESEKLDVFEKERDAGLTSRVHYLMESKGMSEPEAIEHIKKVDFYESITMDDEVSDSNEANNNKERDLPRV
jgi:hypothetical protein